MGKGRNYQHDPDAEKGELTSAVAFGLGRFPNGMPRVVETGDLRNVDGIPHVYYDGAHHPVWSDHRLIVDVEFKSLWHAYKTQETLYDPYSPLRDIDGTHYENTENEAFELAVHTQEDLMARGEFVPIGIRW